jgi:tetratricopeptide (TPR) repeat protein
MKNKILVFLLLFFYFIPLGFCEIVILKSGKKIEGKIIEQTADYIKVDLAGSAVYFQRKYIQSIEAGNKIDIPEAPSPVLQSEVESAFEDSTVYFKRGLEYASAGKFQEAELEFRKGLTINQADHNLKEIIKIIEDSKNDKIGKEYAIFLFKGSNFLLNGQYKEAITEFNEALKLDSSNSDIYYYLGVCHYSLNDYAEAINNLKQSMEMAPDNPDLYYYLGTSNYSIGEFKEAANYLQKALEMSPNDGIVYSVLGLCNYALGQFEIAKQNLNKAKDLLKAKGDYLKSLEVDEFLNKAF